MYDEPEDLEFEDDSPYRKKYTLEDALEALPLKEDDLVPIEVLMGFSDTDPKDLPKIRSVWKSLPDSQRQIIMERMAEASEVDFAVDYAVFALLGYEDTDAKVRVSAVNCSGVDESVATLKRLMALAKDDPSVEVRAAALSQIGRYIYLGEIEEIDFSYTKPAEKLAYDLHTNPDENHEVRRRALEALSQGSHPEINDLIGAAYHQDEMMMKISAVFAMGNTYDPKWTGTVMTELDNEENALRFEAVRAAGSLDLKKSVERLIELGYDPDRQIQEMAIWSLGEIGGTEAVEALSEMELEAHRDNDTDLMEAVEDALAMAQVMSELEDEFDLFDLSSDDDFDEF